MTFWAFFIETAVGRTIGIAIAAAMIGGGTWFAVSKYYYDQGYTAAIAAVAAQDKRAIDAANEAKRKVDACRNSGGDWSVDLGLCRR